jgi:hypothetical protein
MTKNDLKTGMLVELRKGTIGMVLNGIISTKGAEYTADISDFENDLTIINQNEFDIMKVSEVLTNSRLAHTKHWNESVLYSHLKWTRPNPVKEMTVEQIIKELGYEVKIVK